jgi:hypothetical protein
LKKSVIHTDHEKLLIEHYDDCQRAALMIGTEHSSDQPEGYSQYVGQNICLIGSSNCRQNRRKDHSGNYANSETQNHPAFKRAARITICTGDLKVNWNCVKGNKQNS